MSLSVSVAFSAKIQKDAGIIKGGESGFCPARPAPSLYADRPFCYNDCVTGLRLTASDKGGQLCLGFQWDTASWESVPGLWESLFAWLDQRHAFWNLPALPAGLAARKRSALVKPLLARIRPGADSVTAMGFSGASTGFSTSTSLTGKSDGGFETHGEPAFRRSWE